ncbi:MAG: hypothetical protein WD738_07520 [Pirellulales bacterium]
MSANPRLLPRLAATGLGCFACWADVASAITMNPVVIGGVFENPPFDGFADGMENDPFIASLTNRREAAVYEFDFTGTPPGLVESAALIGSVLPNNSFNTGTRIHNVDVYTGNGTIDLADYSVPGIRVGSFSHPSGGHTDFNIDVQGVLHNLLAAGATHIGVRISPGADPQSYDVLENFFELPELTFSLLPAGSTTVQKLPVVDARAELTSGSFVVTDGQTSIGVQRVDFANIDRRAILEFSLSDIPAGSNITSARLDLYLNSFGSSPPEFPTLPFYGYAGNGTAEPVDATQTATPLGETEEIMSTGPFSIELDAEFIESLLGTGNHFGMLIVGSPTFHGVSFVATESTSFTRPTLSLTYVPGAPIAGDYSGNGSVGPEDYDMWRNQFGMTGSLSADGNGNAMVDAADYVVWRKALTTGSGSNLTSAAVPEPATALLMVLCLPFVAFSALSRERAVVVGARDARMTVCDTWCADA